jgi:glucose-6-phosphate 1-dehydrogenase
MTQPEVDPVADTAAGVAAQIAALATTSDVVDANPLRDPRDKRLPRVAGPCVLVLFGVTGDLAKKKLLPAIYDLGNRGLLPPGFSLVGFARREWAHEDFAQVTYEAVSSARWSGSRSERASSSARASSPTTARSTCWR